MATLCAILIGLCLLLLGVCAFLIALVQEYDRREKRYYFHVEVPDIDWDYTREQGWRDAEYEQVNETE